MKTRFIKPAEPNKSRLQTVCVGFVLFSALIAFYLLPTLETQLIGILLVAIATLCSWLLYQRQTNQISFSLTFMHLQYHETKVGWVIQWQNMQSIGQVQMNQQGWYQNTPWWGIKLKDYEPFIASTTPKMAVKILLEDKSLLINAYQNQAHKNKDLDEVLFDDTKYIGKTGTIFTGMQAMLANRMTQNRVYFDYDILISDAHLDRPVEEFIGLTRRYLAQSGQWIAIGPQAH